MSSQRKVSPGGSEQFDENYQNFTKQMDEKRREVEQQQQEDKEKELTPLQRAQMSLDYNKDGSDGRMFFSSWRARIRTRRFVPAAGKVKGLFFWFHGFGNHCRHPHNAKLAHVLNQHGIAWFGMDFPGHGLSGGDPRRFFEDHNDLLLDMKSFVAVTCYQYPDVPFVVAGESMGGCLALLLGLYYQSQQTAHGFTTPSAPNGKSPHEAKRLVGDKANSHKVGASGVEATTKADQWIVSRAFVGVAGVAPAIDNTLEPNCFVSCLLRHCIVPFCPKKQLDSLKAIEPDMVFRDPKVAEARLADPLLSFEPFHLATGKALLDMTHEMQARIREVNFPFFVVHGTVDHVVPISGSENLYNYSATHSQDKTLLVLDGAYHAILEDPKGDEAIAGIVEFTSNRVQAFHGSSDIQLEASVNESALDRIDQKVVQS